MALGRRAAMTGAATAEPGALGRRAAMTGAGASAAALGRRAAMTGAEAAEPGALGRKGAMTGAETAAAAEPGANRASRRPEPAVGARESHPRRRWTGPIGAITGHRFVMRR